MLMKKDEMNGCVFCTTMKGDIARKHVTSCEVCASHLRRRASNLRNIYFHLTFLSTVTVTPQRSKRCSSVVAL